MVERIMDYNNILYSGYHSHIKNILVFNSVNGENHSHSVDISQFNSNNTEDLESKSRATNITVMWSMKI